LLHYRLVLSAIALRVQLRGAKAGIPQHEVVIVPDQIAAVRQGFLLTRIGEYVGHFVEREVRELAAI
jgi:hypothetical protein